MINASFFIKYSYNDGYRAGIDVGQEESLQEGFNTTFKVSSQLLFSVAEIRGLVSGKLSYNLLRQGTLSSDQEQLLQALLGDIVEYETELLTFSRQLYSQLLQEERSCTNDSENVQHVDDNCSAEKENNCRLTDTSSAVDDEPENTTDDNMLKEKVTKELNEKLEISDDINKANELPEVKISQFKKRLKLILMTGS
ncbi:protein YAE1 homolog isoform X2 [Ruditapes philippinarum]|uniref:protein YAE1 homolog isoform X2 n=1 Tax=Ruditapes philippinarum TaxID=129788 RepID=UPI00295C2763|nr:protein YAE1 homolog isoform X2 [Ruditapes philippinarum]